MPHKKRSITLSKTNSWLRKNKFKAFYSLIDGANFQDGATSLMQACGLGKMQPNVLLMGYKKDWFSCPRKDLVMYFNVMHKALDMHLAVALLRLSESFDYDNTEDEIVESKKTTKIPANQSFSQLSQASSISDVSIPGSPVPRKKIGKNNNTDDHAEDASSSSVSNNKKNQNEEQISAATVASTGFIITNFSKFQKKQKKGTIDVWWLYDDGGLTLLLPYIISTRKNWSSCKLRVFALANRYSEMQYEQRK